MFSTARLALALTISFAPFPAPSDTATNTPPAPLVSLDPSISLVGGSPEARRTVADAVTRFTSHGFALPDLEIRLHTDPSGCNGKHGLFHHNHGEPAIDLCYDREFLALHELGHAWEHFNLDDDDRTDFQEFTESSTWNAAAVPHDDRPIEIAADALAHGLLTTPLTAGMHREREFAQFEALTGFAAPRLAEAA